MAKIFISYRRNDAEGEAGRLYDELKGVFGDESVFIDVDAIEPGLDFRGKIKRKIDACSVLIAVIGPNWALSKDSPKGNKRKATDYVHLEIGWALKGKKKVIPVLVRGATMPGSEALPEELKKLLSKNATTTACQLGF